MSKKIILDKESAEFTKKIIELSGEIVTLCEQCGTCSGGCPMCDKAETSPSLMMRMAALGQKEILGSDIIWYCASCYTCTVRCPRGIDISKVAEALRQIILRDSVNRIDLSKLTPAELEKLPQIALVAALRKMTG